MPKALEERPEFGPGLTKVANAYNTLSSRRSGESRISLESIKAYCWIEEIADRKTFLWLIDQMEDERFETLSQMSKEK